MGDRVLWKMGGESPGGPPHITYLGYSNLMTKNFCFFAQKGKQQSCHILCLTVDQEGIIRDAENELDSNFNGKGGVFVNYKNCKLVRQTLFMAMKMNVADETPKFISHFEE